MVHVTIIHSYMHSIKKIMVRRPITLEREPSKKKQRTATKKNANKIKSDNFTRSNRRKFQYCYRNIRKMNGTIIISYLDGSNNIFTAAESIIFTSLLCYNCFKSALLHMFIIVLYLSKITWQRQYYRLLIKSQG